MYRVTELHREEELSYGDVLQEQRSKHPIILSFALFCAEAHRRPLAPGTLARYATGKFLSPKIPWNGLWKQRKAACLELNFLFIPWGDTAHTQVKVHILWLHAPDHEAVPLPTPFSIWISGLGKKWTSGNLSKLLFRALTYLLKNKTRPWTGSLTLWAWKPCSHIVKFPPSLQNWEDWISLPGVGSHP